MKISLMIALLSILASVNGFYLGKLSKDREVAELQDEARDWKQLYELSEMINQICEKQLDNSK